MPTDIPEKLKHLNQDWFKSVAMEKQKIMQKQDSTQMILPFP